MSSVSLFSKGRCLRFFANSVQSAAGRAIGWGQGAALRFGNVPAAAEGAASLRRGPQMFFRPAYGYVLLLFLFFTDWFPWGAAYSRGADSIVFGKRPCIDGR